LALGFVVDHRHWYENFTLLRGTSTKCLIVQRTARLLPALARVSRAP
jgi:hypothetical protein